MEDKHLGGILSNMTLAYVLHSQIVKKNLRSMLYIVSSHLLMYRLLCIYL